ncbi:MAG: ISNCY family transposase [Mesorhizobium sp.]|nr:MAG: ISNCY family transposase [Mesorhizobium sp.]RWK30756.1 MAG: ISNCY family transposase [Mesorhizobium sp.]
MSERELQRIEVLSRVADRRMTTVAAAHVLGLTRRQVQRLLKTLQVDGASGLRHKARGRRSNHQIIDGIRDFTLSLVREHYLDFGPTLAAEKLAEDHGVAVSRETLRKWMAEAGIWLPRKHRRTFHQPRLRREAYGELVQIDGSEHRWFEERGAPCTLLVFIDDATGKLQQLRFVKSESTFSYFEALELYLKAHGCPVAFYSDKHTVFRVAKAEARAGRGMTQFGRALSELNIEILCANSSQAKGRVERVNRTLQDRLVKELRLAGISDVEEANVFLPAFTADFNEKFAKVPARPDNLHRALNMPPDRLRDVLCKREQRYVGQQLSFSYERRQILLEKNDISCGLVGKYVDVYEFADGRLDVRWKACSLPYTVFDKEQRVTHTAITENKRLGEVLSWIKAQQDEARPAPKIKTNSEQNAYRKRGTKPGRRNDFTKDPAVIARRERALAGLAAAE